MAANYLHGVETIDIEKQGQLIRVVKSAVAIVYGIAPKGPSQQLVLCSSDKDDAQFGDPLTGFNIPKTLQIIRKEAGGCPVLVVNTFSLGSNSSDVTAEVHTVANGKVTLDYQPVNDVTILNNDNSPSTLVKDVDYSLDPYGVFTALKTTFTGTLKFTYKKLNAASVNAAQIVGAIDGVTEARTGMKLAATAYNLFGFNPKIIIAPGYSTLSGVQTEMKAQAALFRAVALFDAPASTTVAGAIAGRGIAGTIGFNTSDKRVVLLYPQIKTYDTATNANGNYWYSAFYCGVMIANDQNNGYWWSPSNKEIKSAVGIERNITSNLSDASTEANQLNEVGITTVYASFGTGYRVWGNRNAAYPSNTSVCNFVNIQRTDDIVSESVELGALKYIDRPIDQAFIDLVREEGNAFIRSLVQRGALLPGSKLVYNPADNDPAELAAGHITFERQYMVPAPAERITFKSVLDINLLKALK